VNIHTRTIPDGHELALDPKILRPLLRDALDEAAGALSGREVRAIPIRRRGYVLAEDGGRQETILEIPAYPEFRRELSEPLQRSPAGQALTDYVWSRNAQKLTFSIDGDSEPTKDAWASFTWRHLVLSPLSHLALRFATEDLTLGREHRTWRLTSEALDNAADELVGLFTGGELIVTAFCPLVAVHLGDIGSERETGAELHLAPGISLVEWSWTADQEVFLNQYGHHYRDDDGVRLSRLLKIEIRIPHDSDPIVEVAATIDRVKWALVVATNRDVAIHELATVVTSASGHARDVLHRGAPNFGISDDRAGRSIGWLEMKGWQVIHVGPTLLSRVCGLLAQLSATAESDDLVSAMWSFGRSCVAPTPRDALLDAVVGLERLVVPNERGDSTYRFRLHGQTVLASEGDVFKELGDLYDHRSKVAHGNRVARPGKPNRMAGMGSRARFLLAKAIHATNELVVRGELKLGPDRDISSCIADLVRRRAAKE
jgi:hypothetical protein